MSSLKHLRKKGVPRTGYELFTQYVFGEPIVPTMLEEQLELITRLKELCAGRRNEDRQLLVAMRRIQAEACVREERQMNLSKTRID